MVIPQSVFINKEMKRVNTEWHDIMDVDEYYVPFLSILQRFLEMPEVSDWVTHGQKSSDNTFRDWCVGELLRKEN